MNYTKGKKMKVTILPKLVEIANHDRGDRPFESYINACILKCHGDCQATKIIKELQAWLDEVIHECHVTEKHNPQYDVVKHHFEGLIRKYEGER